MRPLNSSSRESLAIATNLYEAALHADEAGQTYLRGRGISPATWEQFRLGIVTAPITGHEQFRGRLAIPALGPGGSVSGLRFRSIDGSDPKYLGMSVPTRLFNVRAITESADTICITEGELDAIALAECNYPAVGVPGAQAWKRHHPRMFAGFPRVLVFGDGDKPGRDFARKVVDSILSATNVMLPEGADVNDILVREGVDGIRKLIGDTAS